jgi:hypothetical protein
MRSETTRRLGTAPGPYVEAHLPYLPRRRSTTERLMGPGGDADDRAEVSNTDSWVVLVVVAEYYLDPTWPSTENGNHRSTVLDANL